MMCNGTAGLDPRIRSVTSSSVQVSPDTRISWEGCFSPLPRVVGRVSEPVRDT